MRHVLIFLASLAAGGCAGLTPIEHTLVDCGEQGLATEITAIGPQVQGVLDGPSFNVGSIDWAAQLTQLETTSEDAVDCAVEAVATSSSTADLAIPQQVAILRAETWLDVRGIHPSPAAGAQLRILRPPRKKP